MGACVVVKVSAVREQQVSPKFEALAMNYSHENEWYHLQLPRSEIENCMIYPPGVEHLAGEGQTS